jgi:hypothetical protein
VCTWDGEELDAGDAVTEVVICIVGVRLQRKGGVFLDGGAKGVVALSAVKGKERSAR